MSLDEAEWYLKVQDQRRIASHGGRFAEFNHALARHEREIKAAEATRRELRRFRVQFWIAIGGIFASPVLGALVGHFTKAWWGWP